MSEKMKKITSSRIFNKRTFQFERIPRVNYKCEDLTEDQNCHLQEPIKQSLERESPIHTVANSIISYPENAEGRFEGGLKLSEICKDSETKNPTVSHR